MQNSRKPYSILIAEDDPISRRLFQKILSREGFSVTTVENGRQALERFRQEFFPIVLTDWQMPEIEGPALCRTIREENADRYVFIVLLTSKGGKEDIISGLNAGADDYLIKPAHPAELVARINTGIRILELEKSLKDAVDEIQLMSITDPLTGIYNRGYINQRLPQEIRRAQRYGRAFSLVMCDIDHFKKVNDTHGHLAGDSVLRSFARRLADGIRQQVDWVGRYGGEEFLVILPETDLDGATVLAERLRAATAAHAVTTGGHTIHITASFGVAGFSASAGDSQITSDALLEEADNLLYQAKRDGRDQVASRLVRP